MTGDETVRSFPPRHFLFIYITVPLVTKVSNCPVNLLFMNFYLSRLLLIICVLFLCQDIDAQDSVTSATADTTIIDHFTAVGGNSVVQPEALLLRLKPILDPSEIEESDERRSDTPSASHSRPAGWRVQVFSDNNPRTAKAEASKKERLISARFPQHQAYVRYNAPYWRLRIGDFRTQQEANSVADELRKAFPAYSKEIRVVRDRITLPSD